MSEENEVADVAQEPVEPVDQSAPDSLLGGKEVELGEGEWFLAENIKGVGDKPDWYNDGKYKTLADQAKAHPELRKKLGGFTGAPEEGYETPEGFEEGDELLEQFKSVALESNMSQDTFGKLFELYQAQSGVNEQLSVEAEMAKLGDNAEQRISQVENFLRNNAGDAYEEIQNMANDANSIMLIEKMINVMAPKKMPIDGGEHPEGLTMDKVMEMSMKKNESGQYLRSVDPEYNAKIEKLMAQMDGSSSHIVYNQ